MDETKTTLQKIVEQKADQIRMAIERAIDDGTKIEECYYFTPLRTCCSIEGVFLQKNTYDGSISVILNFRSEKIAKVFEPSKDDLEKMAEQKRAELADIEKQIKEKEAENEADHN